jgi:hypothetical protein
MSDRNAVPWELLRRDPRSVIRETVEMNSIRKVRTSSAGAAHYELVPRACADKSLLESSVEVSPDQFRRHSSHYRSAMRSPDAPTFGFVIDGAMAAVLRRSSDYVPLTEILVEEYRSILARLNRANHAQSSSGLSERVTLVELRLAEVEKALLGSRPPQGRNG